MIDLERLVTHQPLINDLLERLNQVAKEDGSDCGLPLYDRNATARLREIVYEWIVKVNIAERLTDAEKNA